MSSIMISAVRYELYSAVSAVRCELYCDERAAKIPLGLGEAAASSYSSISNTKTFLTFCRNMFWNTKEICSKITTKIRFDRFKIHFGMEEAHTSSFLHFQLFVFLHFLLQRGIFCVQLHKLTKFTLFLCIPFWMSMRIDDLYNCKHRVLPCL